MEKDMRLGEVFESYEEFVEALNRYCHKEYVSFYKREARTISGARKKTARYINPKLKYYQLKYVCIKGGKKFKSSGSGKRNTSTYKDGCNAHITLRASQCGTKLQIISTETNHNHQISKQLYDHLPQQRHLPEDIQTEIIQLAKLKTKRKQIKCYVEEKCNKIVLLKDIHNMAKKFKKKEAADVTLSSSIEKLQTKYGADCHLLSDEENQFKALLFQTKMMKHYMSVYPEFICIDTTFKLLDIRTPVLLIINEDGNGLSEIIAVGILVEENTDTMQWLLSTFKDSNPRWREVKSIMADKDLNERRLLKENFPNANVLICIFHAMRTFNREISINKLGITVSQRQTALAILQKMVYSRNPVTYNTLYEDLLKNCPLMVIEYFNKNWHNIKDEWTLGPKFQQANFLNTTNNRLESLNGKIKSLVERYSSLPDFIDDFFKLIMVMNDERDHKAANFIYKVPVSFYENDSTLHKYFKFLTTYAFQFIKKQFLKRNNSSNAMNYETTTQSCNCGSRTSMLLPCKHIFRKREEVGMDTYDESLCNERWTRKHYYSNQRLFITDNSLNEQDCDELQPPGNSHTVVKAPILLNQHQKFSKAWLLLKSLASLISEEGNTRYHAKLRQLIQLKTAWENDKDVTIVEQDEVTENIINETEAYSNIDAIGLMNEKTILADTSEVVNNESLVIQNNLISANLILDNIPIINTISDLENVVNCEIDITDVLMAENNSIPIPENSHSNDLSNTLKKDDNVLNVANVVLPVAIRKRGRPKGLNNTVIGLSKKTKKRIRKSGTFNTDENKGALKSTNTEEIE